MARYSFGKGVPTWNGVPMIGGLNRYAGLWGDIYFVNNDNGSDGDKGIDSSKPFKTIGKAITKANRFDSIYVKPRIPKSDASDPENYEEELVIPYAKDHLSIIGTVSGFDNFYGPKLKLGTADAVVDVYAPAFSLENFTVHRRSSNTKAIYLRGETGYAAKAGAVASHIANCMIRYASTYGIYVEGGYHCNVLGCTFWGGINDVYLVGSGIPQRGMQVHECWFGSANGVVTAGPNIRLLGECTELLIKGCDFDYVPSGGIWINASGNVDGLVTECNFAHREETTDVGTATGECRDGAGSLSFTNNHGGTGALVAHGT